MCKHKHVCVYRLRGLAPCRKPRVSLCKGITGWSVKSVTERDDGDDDAQLGGSGWWWWSRMLEEKENDA